MRPPEPSEAGTQNGPIRYQKLDLRCDWSTLSSNVIILSAPAFSGKSDAITQVGELFRRHYPEGKVLVVELQRVLAASPDGYESFMKQFGLALWREAGIEGEPLRHWVPRYTAESNLTTLVETLLDELSTDVLLALDNVDLLIDRKMDGGFFAVIRGLLNRTGGQLDRLHLLMTISMRVKEVQGRLSNSIFNPEVIPLLDLTESDVEAAARACGVALSRATLDAMMRDLGGQYLMVREALDAIARAPDRQDEVARDWKKVAGVRRHLEDLTRAISGDGKAQAFMEMILSRGDEPLVLPALDRERRAPEIERLVRLGVVVEAGTSAYRVRNKLYRQHMTGEFL